MLEWGKLRLNTVSYEVFYAEQSLILTPKEYHLLELFLRHRHRIFSRSTLIDQLWSDADPPSEGTVTTHIMSLRRKLKQAGADPELIETVYGLGYRLKPLERPQVSIEETQTTITKSQSALAAMAAAWEELKAKAQARDTLFDHVIAALQVGTLTSTLQQEAAQEAHRWAGSLGSFGFTIGSDLARSLETLLQSVPLLAASQAEPLVNLVTALRLELANPPTGHPVSTTQPMPVVLLVDNAVDLAAQMHQEAAVWGVRLESALNLASARHTIALHPPDLILLDLNFDDGSEDGLALLEELSTRTPVIPSLVFAVRDALSGQLAAVRLGRQAYLHKPIRSTQVLEAVTHVLSQTKQPNATLLLVDDTEEDRTILQTLLELWGFQLVTLDKRTFGRP
ncbi:MAG: winged helix-turn-helix domain-containing protein [Leptolyngbya sp. BL-A-14]